MATLTNGVLYRVQYNDFPHLSSDSINLLKKLEKNLTSYLFQPDSALIGDLQKIEATELKKLLSCLFIQVLKKDGIQNPNDFFERLVTLFPVGKMEEITEKNVTDVLQNAKMKCEEAKYYLNTTQKESKAPSFINFFTLFNGLIILMENLISSIGIRDFFKPVEGGMDADSNLKNFLAIVSFISIISAILLPLFGTALGSLLVSVLLLSLAAISISWSSIKPMTTHLPGNAQNWTAQINGNVPLVQVRTEILDQIADSLKIKRHVMISGPSGVGKTFTAKALTQAIANGDYPELKDKVIFCLNAAKLVTKQTYLKDGANNKLNEVSEAMGCHRENIILVIEEIHNLCKEIEPMADDFKHFLNGDVEFPYVIGITTEEKYQKHIKDRSEFSLYFDLIQIEGTNEKETLKIMADALLSSTSTSIVSTNVLKYIYDQSSQRNSPQPLTALNLLKRCILRTDKTQRLPIEIRISKLADELLSLQAQAALRSDKKRKITQQIATLTNEMEELKKTLLSNQNEISALFRARELFHHMKKETYHSAIRVSQIAQGSLNEKEEHDIKLFLLLHEVFNDSLGSYIKEKSEILNVKTFIDESLVNEVLLSSTTP